MSHRQVMSISVDRGDIRLDLALLWQWPIVWLLSSVLRQLSTTIKHRIIGRGGTISWPPRSPDLTPPHFFLCGVLKDAVYAHKPRTVQHLQRHIEDEIGLLNGELIKKVCQSVPSRLQKCVEKSGAQTELFWGRLACCQIFYMCLLYVCKKWPNCDKLCLSYWRSNVGT